MPADSAHVPVLSLNKGTCGPDKTVFWCVLRNGRCKSPNDVIIIFYDRFMELRNQLS